MHILINIPSMNYNNYFVTKKFLNNIPYRKLSQDDKQYFKTKTCFSKTCLSNKVLPYLYTARIW